MTTPPLDPPGAPGSARPSGAAHPSGPPATGGESLQLSTADTLPPEAPAGAGTPGPSLGRFRLLERIGEGGMGTVWKAWDGTLRRTLALKVIQPEGEARPAALARLMREARLAVRLRHPQIVTVHDAGTAGDLAYIAMDLIDGRTFAAWLAETRATRRPDAGPVAARLRPALELLAQVADAVGYAHRNGIIHRDLKPANVLVDRAGHPYVTDFGLAKEVELTPGSRAPSSTPALTRAGQILGTPLYMSPEQADAAPLGPATDVWSLGVMLYEIVTGDLPFEGCHAYEVVNAVIEGWFVPPRRRAPGVPEELEAVCLNAMERRPEDRYRNASELAADLTRWLAGQPVLARRRGAAARAWRWVARRRRVFLSAALGAALVLGALDLAWRERTRRAAQAQADLAQIASAVTEFEDSVQRAAPPPEAVRTLAEQPLGLLACWIAADPRHGPAHAWRGKVKEILGDLPGAAQDFDRACELAPERAVVWYLRGMHRIGRYAAARRLPAIMYGSTGVRFAPSAPETAGEAELRRSGLADLTAMMRAAEKDASLGADEERIGRAQAALARGAEDGYEEAARLLAGLPGPRAQRLHGLALYLGRRFEAAAEVLGTALAGWPADAQARLWRAAAWRALGQTGGSVRVSPMDCYRAAIADYGGVLTTEPLAQVARLDRGDAWRVLAEAQAAAGDDPRAAFARAIADCTRVAATAPGDTQAFVTRALAHLSLGNALQARRLDPAPEYAAVIADCGATLKLAPGDASAFVNRAAALVALGQVEAERGGDPRARYAAAVADSAAALRLIPDAAEAHINSGNARMCAAHYEETHGGDGRATYRAAISDWTALLERRPGYRDARFARGAAWEELARAQARQGDDPAESCRQAEGDLSAAAEAGDVRARVRLGLLYREVGRPDEAMRALEAAAAADPAQAPQLRAIIEEIRREGK